MGKFLLWDVDTQEDFIEPRGKLAVPTTTKFFASSENLVRVARDSEIIHLATADSHEWFHNEISLEPDFVNTFPPHCMRGTKGEWKIFETAQHYPYVIGFEYCYDDSIPWMIENQREILLLKDRTNIFEGNPNADLVLDALNPDHIFVFGIVHEICVDQAVMGLLTRGHKVTVVEEACLPLDHDKAQKVTEKWSDMGADFMDTADVIKLWREG